VILKSVICLKSSWIPKADIKVVNTHLTFSRKGLCSKKSGLASCCFSWPFQCPLSSRAATLLQPNRSWKQLNHSDRQYAHEQIFCERHSYKLGGLGGCGMGMVKKDINNDGSFSQTINDAQITINSANLTVDTSLGLYSTSSLSADAGTAYNMTAKEGGATIATGYAIMPSTPIISAPANLSNHAINTALPLHGPRFSTLPQLKSVSVILTQLQ